MFVVMDMLIDEINKCKISINSNEFEIKELEKELVKNNKRADTARYFGIGLVILSFILSPFVYFFSLLLLLPVIPAFFVLMKFEGKSDKIKEQIKANFTAGIIEGENIGFVASNFIQKNGIKIPEDFSLITWGMPDFSEHLYPSITSLIQDFHALADNTIKTLLALWNGQSVPILSSVPYIFYEGESTKVLASTALKK